MKYLISKGANANAKDGRGLLAVDHLPRKDEIGSLDSILTNSDSEDEDEDDGEDNEDEDVEDDEYNDDNDNDEAAAVKAVLRAAQEKADKTENEL